MTLRELIKLSPYKDVFNHIYKNYYLNKSFSQDEIIQLDLSFRSSLKELSELSKCNNVKYDLKLIKLESGEINDIDVTLFEKSSKTEFAVDFCFWSEIIDSEIINTIDMSDAELLSHILWELTFWGFSEKEISKQRKATLESKEEVIDFDLNSLNNVLL